jgi:hypothetical protein
MDLILFVDYQGDTFAVIFTDSAIWRCLETG